MAYLWRSFARRATLVSPCFLRSILIKRQSFVSSHPLQGIGGGGLITGGGPAAGGVLLPSSWRWISNDSVATAEDKITTGGGGGGVPLSSSFSRLSSLPWLMLPAGAGEMIYRFYSLAAKRVIGINKRSYKQRHSGRLQEEEEDVPDDDAVCVGSSHGWLAFINPSDCALYLSNPISRRNIRLPPIQTLPCMLRDDARPFTDMTPQQWSRFIIKMLILSSSPDDDYCTVMVIQGEDPEKLAFCRLGDATWTALDDGPLVQYEQVSYLRKHKLFYAVTYFGEFEAWDLRDPSAPKRHPINDLMVDSEYHPFPAKSEAELIMKSSQSVMIREYIAEEPSSGELLMIRRFVAHHVAEDGSIVNTYDIDCDLPYKTLAFDVYQLDITKDGYNVMRYQKCLNDRVLFLGLNHSFCLSARDFPGLRPNSIYFTNDITPLLGRRRDGGNMGVYNYEDDTIAPCYPCDSKNKSDQVWFIPNPC